MSYIEGRYRPIDYDSRAKVNVKTASVEYWIAKLREEVHEVHIAMYQHDKRELAVELTDVITVCVSWLDALGYDAGGRAEMANIVNAKNERRGRFVQGD